jgi:hypothetical protein
VLLQVGAAAPALAADLSVAPSPAAVVAGQASSSKMVAGVAAPSGERVLGFDAAPATQHSHGWCLVDGALRPESWCIGQRSCLLIKHNTVSCIRVPLQDAVLANAAMHLGPACMHTHGQLPCNTYDMATVYNTDNPARCIAFTLHCT